MCSDEMLLVNVIDELCNPARVSGGILGTHTFLLDKNKATSAVHCNHSIPHYLTSMAQYVKWTLHYIDVLHMIR